MKRFAVSVVFVFITSAFAQQMVSAETPVRMDGLLYYVPVSFHNTTVKQKSTIDGAYFYYGKGESYSIETEYDQTDIEYKNNFDYTQRDYTLVYSKYEPGGKNRFGSRLIDSSTGTDDAMTLFMGTAKYKKSGGAFQIDMYVSRYGNYDPDVIVYQLTPGYGRTYSRSDKSSFYLQTKANIIQTSKHVGGNQRMFFSIEQSASYTVGKVTAAVTGWAGKQMLAVRNDGFVVFNTVETHRGGYGFSLSRVMSLNTKITLSVDRELFRESGASYNSSSSKVGVSIGHTF